MNASGASYSYTDLRKRVRNAAAAMSGQGHGWHQTLMGLLLEAADALEKLEHDFDTSVSLHQQTQRILTETINRLSLEEVVTRLGTFVRHADNGVIWTETIDAAIRFLMRPVGPSVPVESYAVAETAELVRDALAYIKHVGSNYTERGQPHPQQWLVEKLEAWFVDSSSTPATARPIEQEKP